MRHGRPQLRRHQQGHPPRGDLPPRRRRHHGRRRGRATTRTTPPARPGQPTTRSSPSRRWPTRTASPAVSAATAATRGAATTRTTRSPTSATTAATSTSWPRASASGRRSRAATPTCPGRRWPPRPSPAPSRSTRRAGPNATPAEVREALRYLGNLNWKTSTDPDSTHEPLLDVSRIGDARDLRLRAGAGRQHRRGRRRRPRSRSRSRAAATFFERVRFSVTNAAGGVDRRLEPSSLMGWTANSGDAPRDRPEGHAAGRATRSASRRPTRAVSSRRVVPVDVVERRADRARARRRPRRRRDGPVRLARHGLVARRQRSVERDRRLRAADRASTAARGARDRQRRPRRSARQPVALATHAYRFRVRTEDSVGQLEPVGHGRRAPGSTRSTIGVGRVDVHGRLEAASAARGVGDDIDRRPRPRPARRRQWPSAAAPSPWSDRGARTAARPHLHRRRLRGDGRCSATSSAGRSPRRVLLTKCGELGTHTIGSARAGHPAGPTHLDRRFVVLR